MTIPHTRLGPPPYFKQESAPDMQSLARTVASRPHSASSQPATQVSSEYAKDYIANLCASHAIFSTIQTSMIPSAVV